MKRLSLTIFILASTAVICFTGAATQTQPPVRQLPQTTAQRQLALEKTTTTQQRLNRYFHADVMPKLKNCWSRLQGKGTIEMEHSYRRDANGKWVAAELTIGKSTLAKEQNAVALQCMQDSVQGTAFPAEGRDGKGTSYVANWTWPVPFPANADTLTNNMFSAKPKGGGGGGCDGHGALAKCWTCDNGKCLKVCVGFKTCKITFFKGISYCGTDGDCASGGPFGVTGGVVMY